MLNYDDELITEILEKECKYDIFEHLCTEGSIENCDYTGFFTIFFTICGSDTEFTEEIMVKTQNGIDFEVYHSAEIGYCESPEKSFSISERL